METIHLKTVDPVSQALLREASARNIDLAWDRAERLQPQDGFLRLGLCCPFDCLYGPCRIDPFGRGPRLGICGMDRDEMVAGTLLRLCLRGAMETTAAWSALTGGQARPSSKQFFELAGQARAAHGLTGLSPDLVAVSRQMLRSPESTSETMLRQTLRLAIFSLEMADQLAPDPAPQTIACSFGYGVVSEHTLRVGLTGLVSPAHCDALRERLGQDAQLVSLGEWICEDRRFLPIACSSGEAELLIGSGAIHLVFAGPGASPAITQLCRRQGIALLTGDPGAAWPQALAEARACLARLTPSPSLSQVPGAVEIEVCGSVEEFACRLPDNRQASSVLLGGSDTPLLTLGKIAQDLAARLDERGAHLAGWGDSCLWALKGASATPSGPPLRALDGRQGPLLAVKGLASAGRLDTLQGVCFTGLKSCRELTEAIGLAAIGCRVCLAVPLPLFGSQGTCDILERLLGANGGELRYFDHPASAEEIIQWLDGR